jgi:hypothetical protein
VLAIGEDGTFRGVLELQTKLAREYAESEVYRQMAPADRQARDGSCAACAGSFAAVLSEVLAQGRHWRGLGNVLPTAQGGFEPEEHRLIEVGQCLCWRCSIRQAARQLRYESEIAVGWSAPHGAAVWQVEQLGPRAPGCRNVKWLSPPGPGKRRSECAAKACVVRYRSDRACAGST